MAYVERLRFTRYHVDTTITHGEVSLPRRTVDGFHDETGLPEHHFHFIQAENVIDALDYFHGPIFRYDGLFGLDTGRMKTKPVIEQVSIPFELVPVLFLKVPDGNLGDHPGIDDHAPACVQMGGQFIEQENGVFLRKKSETVTHADGGIIGAGELYLQGPG